MQLRANMAKSLPKGRSFASNVRDRFFYFNYEKNPNPINVTTLFPTIQIADDRNSHPYQIKTIRRLEQFDPTKLHLSVAAPTDLAKSVFVRRTIARRFKEAFRQELRRQGWNPDGRRRPEGGPAGDVRTFDLKGALRLGLLKDAHVLTATSDDVRESISWAVQTLAGLQNKDNERPQHERPQQRRPARQDSRWRGAGEYAEGRKTKGFQVRRVTHR